MTARRRRAGKGGGTTRGRERTSPQHVRLEALNLFVEVVEERRAPAGQVGAELVRRVGRRVGAVLGDEGLFDVGVEEVGEGEGQWRGRTEIQKEVGRTWSLSMPVRVRARTGQ